MLQIFCLLANTDITKSNHESFLAKNTMSSSINHIQIIQNVRFGKIVHTIVPEIVVNDHIIITDISIGLMMRKIRELKKTKGEY